MGGGRARRGVSGALYPQSAIAGSNSPPRGRVAGSAPISAALMAGYCAARAREPRQVRKEAALSGPPGVPQPIWPEPLDRVSAGGASTTWGARLPPRPGAGGGPRDHHGACAGPPPPPAAEPPEAHPWPGATRRRMRARRARDGGPTSRGGVTPLPPASAAQARSHGGTAGPRPGDWRATGSAGPPRGGEPLGEEEGSPRPSAGWGIAGRLSAADVTGLY